MSNDVRWTPDQSLALRRRGNTLVSAAAGSGKTTALAGKIIRLLTESGARLDRMLVVTFTKASAEELRAKIGKALREQIAVDPSAADHLGDLPSAEIGTIHSFLLKALREYYSELGLPPGISVIETESASELKSDAAEDTIEDLFSGSASDVPENEMGIAEICDVFGDVKTAAAELIKTDDEFGQRGAGTDRFREFADTLDRYAGKDVFESPWGGEIRADLEEGARYLISALAVAAPHLRDKFVPFADRLSDWLSRFLDAVVKGDREAIVKTADSLAGDVGDSPRNTGKDLYAAICQDVKKDASSLAGKAAERLGLSDGEIADAMRRTARFVRGLGRAADLYTEKYTERKRERGKLDYKDIETYAFRLFVGEDGRPTEAAKRVGKRFEFIFVDEYQDTNAIQDAIFRAVGANSERFLVGDIKQAIYQFRGGDPEVFSRYREEWETVSGGDFPGDGDVTAPRDAGVFMSENFRCSEPVVRFANAVSRYMFPHGGIPFCERDELVFASGSKTDDPVSVCLINSEKGKTREPHFIARTILGMLGRDLYGTGPLRPEDFAILLATNAECERFASVLSEYGIPTSVQSGVPLKEEEEVVLALNILKTIDNPYRDVPLIGMMYSSVGGFSLDDLVRIRQKYGDGLFYSAVKRTAESEPVGADADIVGKCAGFCAAVERYRTAERSTPADAFIEYVFNESGLMHAPEVTGKADGARRLRSLIDMAREYEDGPFGGLFGFLTHVENKIRSDNFKMSFERGGAVRIITRHRSKGLEFPVCFLSGVNKSYNERSLSATMLAHRDLGVGIMIPSGGGLTNYDNPVRAAIGERLRVSQREEHMRTLYVAMTRAKYKLFVTAECKPEAEIGKAKRSALVTGGYGVRSDKRMLDHILKGIFSSSESVCRLSALSGEDVDNIGPETPADEIGGETPAADAAEDAAVLRAERNFTFEYPYSFLSNLPSKLAVSALYPEVLDDRDGAAVLPEEEPEDDGMPYPTFMTGTFDHAPADRGTANHVFLQFADFGRLRGGDVGDELKRLVGDGFLTPRMGELVLLPLIDAFRRGELFRRITDAAEVWREFRFNVRLPAWKFTSDSELAEKYEKTGTCVTVQGVFDCVFREKSGRLVLVDYKTDGAGGEIRDPASLEKKLRERHRLQLKYYREAASLLFGRDPDEVLIWSLPLGKSVDLSDITK